MFRLFRGIRQKLINDAKFGKYMLYATGEVLILILGILIAFQVNNWDEKRQNEITEIEMLKAIKGGLEIDLINFEGDKVVHQQQIVSSQIILNHLENDLAYHDSLAVHFSNTANFTVFFVSRGAYETLQSAGVSIISNPELRDTIITLYDGLYPYGRLMAERVMDKGAYVENFVFNSRFDQALYVDSEAWYESGALLGSMVPLNYEQLKNDKEYFFALKSLRNYSLNYIDDIIFINNFVSGVIIDIEEELLKFEH